MAHLRALHRPQRGGDRDRVQICVHDRAIVSRDASGAQSPLQHESALLTDVEADVHTVEVFGLPTEIVGEGHEIVHLTQLVLIEVVQATDEIAASVWQTRIDRRRDAKWREIGRRNSEVLGDREISVYAPEVADVHTGPRSQLMLNPCRELPIVGTPSPSR